MTLNLHKFARDNRRIDSKIPDKVTKFIIDSIPELKGDNIIDPLLSKLDDSKRQRAIEIFSDKRSSDISKSFMKIRVNIELLFKYLSEDSSSTIKQILEGKIIDPYVQCAALSISEFMNDFGPTIIKKAVDIQLSEDQLESNRLSWRIIRSRLTDDYITK